MPKNNFLTRLKKNIIYIGTNRKFFKKMSQLFLIKIRHKLLSSSFETMYNVDLFKIRIPKQRRALIADTYAVKISEVLTPGCNSRCSIDAFNPFIT